MYAKYTVSDVLNLELDNLNKLTILLAKSFDCVKPSVTNDTSAINSLSGAPMATGLNNAFRLSGNLDRPPYPLPAGF